MRGLVAVGAGLLAGALGAMPVDAFEEALTTVPSRPGVTTSALVVSPSTAPIATVVLFAGRHGGLGLSPAGIAWGEGNFLVRNRARFAEHGFLVAVIDAPSDRRDSGLWNFRTSPEHATDVKAVSQTGEKQGATRSVSASSISQRSNSRICDRVNGWSLS